MPRRPPLPSPGRVTLGQMMALLAIWGAVVYGAATGGAGPPAETAQRVACR